MSERTEPRETVTWGMTRGQLAFLLVAVLTVARFALAPIVPLAFDEAYYWRWSLHPSFGYYDHPPLVAWLIALGTSIAGHTEFGVRLIPLLLSVPASWAVWRSAILLFGHRGLAWTALVFFNLTLIVAVGTILATPDASLLIASAFLLYCLAKIATTGRPVWWIVAGIVLGVGLLAKFTALFWVFSVFVWLVLSPGIRTWLQTPWPWIGAAIGLLVFFPNLVWNATHDWATFDKQFGRVVEGTIQSGFVTHHIASQIGMATPLIFVLGWLGLAALATRRAGTISTRVMLSALVWPPTIYFFIHSLHARVEGNWTGPIFPAFVIAAAAAVYVVQWHGRMAGFVDLLRRWAAPIGVLLVVAVYGQTLIGWVPLGRADPTATHIGAGMEAIALEVEDLRREEGASLVLTADYHLTGWLSFYNPTRPAPVYQFDEPERWMQETPPSADELAGPLLLVLPADEDPAAAEATYGTAEEIATLTRRRGALLIADYKVYRLPGAP